jgi:hypothetical protein
MKSTDKWTKLWNTIFKNFNIEKKILKFKILQRMIRK